MCTNKRVISVWAALSLIIILALIAKAEGPGTSAETILNDPLGARPSALGGAFSAATNDISALGYNPATLKSLQESHLSFIYQKGLMDDSKGHVSFGVPMNKQTLGFSVGYYNGGDIKTLNGATNEEETVNAKKEINFMVGSGFEVGKMALGISGKFISSELAETEKATAFAADLGLQTFLSPKLSVGLALQNIGTRLKYAEEGDDLNRTVRAGAQWQFSSKVPSTLFIDLPYSLVNKELESGLGLEVMVGPLALRGGYQDVSDEQSLSFGVGFMLAKMTLDYTYGLADELDDQHLVSVGLRFGNSAPDSNKDEVKQPEPRKQVAFQFEKHKSLGGQIYEIKSGDSLGAIAQQMYGSRDAWKRIYEANRHLLKDPTTLTPGQKVVLP